MTNLNLPADDRGRPPVCVEVWGPQAMFTRPEAKAERLTYPVMTPSAAVGILEAILWKPEFRWRPVAIEVLAPIHEARIRRNETSQVVPLSTALAGGTADVEEHRAQRTSTYLRDVRYRIHAHVELTERARPDQFPPKYRDMFERRVERGAAFHQPHLGVREYTADFGPRSGTPPIDVTADLGVMIHTADYTVPGSTWSWFTARLDRGVLHIPATGIRIGGDR